MLKSACFILTFLGCVWPLQGFRFHLAPNTRKCFKEDMQVNLFIKGEYEVFDVPGQVINYIARNSKGHVLSQEQKITKGKFNFTSKTYDIYEFCFISQVPKHQHGINQEVSLVTKRGVETKNYDGEVTNLKPIEVDLKRLEDLSDAIMRDFVVIRKRDEQMSDTNEKTNGRVFIFSIFSLSCMFGLATWQVLYLRQYFKVKKLVE